jgi:uncharacterized protein YjbI with pentapeptide repeats
MSRNLHPQHRVASLRLNTRAREIVRGGGKAWNRFRRRYGHIHFDLSALDLRGVDLSYADLSYALMQNCKLRGCLLRNASFADADLSNSDLSESDLTGAKMYEATLVDCSFRKTILSDTSFFWSTLRGADFADANLLGADLTGIEDLSGVDMSHATMGYTILGDIDLSHVRGLETVIHDGPSTVGIDTIYASGGNIPSTFLANAGIPDDFITYIPSLVGSPLAFYSCFISHSSKDKKFCNTLYKHLRAKGVRTWYFPENATWGKPVWGEIDRAIVHYDKLIVVCSKHSLRSGPVIREMERALQREDRTGKNILFPIQIDNFLFKEWTHPRKADVVSKVVGDFRAYMRDTGRYRRSLSKLIQALRQE